jgi:hypothetical protein
MTNRVPAAVVVYLLAIVILVALATLDYVRYRGDDLAPTTTEVTT